MLSLHTGGQVISSLSFRLILFQYKISVCRSCISCSTDCHTVISVYQFIKRIMVLALQKFFMNKRPYHIASTKYNKLLIGMRFYKIQNSIPKFPISIPFDFLRISLCDSRIATIRCLYILGHHICMTPSRSYTTTYFPHTGNL